MTPVVIGDAKLYLGDCLEILPTLPRHAAVITDPPYSANTHRNAKTNKGKGYGTTLVTFAALSGEEFDRVVDACLWNADGWVVMTCDYKHAARCFDHDAFVRLGAWVKTNPMPQISGDRPGQGFETVAILHNTESRKAWNRGGCAAVWTFPTHGAGAEVPTQKPLDLIASFVSDFTGPGESVCDPFMGSGTTGVACIQMGRLFTGIEKDTRHFEIALKRIEAAYAQGRLFEEPQAAPEQKTLLGGAA